MTEKEKLKESIWRLIRSQKLAVLSTCRDNQPYASLVAFAAFNDLRSIVFATPRSTRKYANLKMNPETALLIDSRSNREHDFHEASAATVLGTSKDVLDADRDRCLNLYLNKHPYMQEFVDSPTTALLEITVRSYYLVSRFQNVMEFHIDDETDSAP